MLWFSTIELEQTILIPDFINNMAINAIICLQFAEHTTYYRVWQ